MVAGRVARGVTVLLVVVGCGSGSSPSSDAADGRTHDAAAGAAGGASGTSGSGGASTDAGGAGAPVDAAEAGATPDASGETPDSMPTDVGGGGDGPADGATGADAGPTVTGWVPLGAPLGAPMTAIALDSAGVFYAGAGGGDLVSSSPSAGLFRSADSGRSWRAINNGVRDFHVGGLWANGATLFAGTARVLASTNGGDAWTEVTKYGASLGTLGVIGGQGTLVVAGNVQGGDALEISNDGGQTFTATTYGVQVTNVAVLGDVIVQAGPNGISRSADRGATFTKVQGITNGLGFDATLGCDGVQTCYATAHMTMFDQALIMKSTDAGATWTSTGKNAREILAVADAMTVYAGTDPTMARSDDGGASWTLVQFPTTVDSFQPNCAGPLVARGDRVLAACGDGVYVSGDRARHWAPANGSSATGAITGAAGKLLVDKSAGSLAANGDLYVVSAGNGPNKLWRSTDDGRSWQAVQSPFSASSCLVTGKGALECATLSGSTGTMALGRSEDHGATFVPVTAPLSGTVLASLGNTVYLGGSGVARSTDDGVTFQPLGGAPTSVQAMQVLANGHVLASTFSGTSRSIDGGGTWTPLAHGVPLPVLEDGRGHLLLGQNDGEVVTSSDEGNTWQYPAIGTLPSALQPIGPLGMDGRGRIFVREPNPNQTLFVSVDDAATWTQAPLQLPNPNVTSFATDKAGRLLAATTGGVFRLDEVPAGPGDAGVSDAGAPDGGPAPKVRALTRVLTGAPWKFSQTAQQLAADANHRVYRSDDQTVYAVDGATVSTYLTVAEAAAQSSFLGGTFQGIDVGPDGALYALVFGTSMATSKAATVIARSTGAHLAASYRVVSTDIASSPSVVSANEVAFVDSKGLWTASPTAQTLVYATAQVQSTQRCAAQDLAASATGVFLYAPGCLEYPLLRGNLDGSGVGVLYDDAKSPAFGGTFACLARDPSGGFFVMVTDVNGASPRLYHVAETASGSMGLEHVLTDPSFGEARLTQSETNAFAYCSLATAPDGTIYYATGSQLWQVAP